MILKPAPVSTRQLTYDAGHRCYSGEISSTNGFGRVYDDACDEGLTLVSARTGVEVTFVVVDTIRDRDGDLVGWRLEPAGPVSADLAGVAVVLFND